MEGYPESVALVALLQQPGVRWADVVPPEGTEGR